MDKFREECNNWNEVTELVDKLVQLVDTSKEKEALELRDKIYEIFTKEYSEPIWNYLNLEEEIGCPLDVYVKIQLGLVDKVYIKWYKTIDVKWHDGEADIIQEEVTMPFTITRVDKKYFRYQAILGKEDIPFSNYGKEFWLKEDRSE